MLDQINFHYKTKRANFGRTTSSFEDTKSQMIMRVEPDYQIDINLELISFLHFKWEINK